MYILKNDQLLHVFVVEMNLQKKKNKFDLAGEINFPLPFDLNAHSMLCRIVKIGCGVLCMMLICVSLNGKKEILTSYKYLKE